MARLCTFINCNKELGFDSSALWVALGSNIKMGLIRPVMSRESKSKFPS